jgi:hypothetical protein
LPILAALGLALLALEIPVCPVAALTGLPCPGCGLTRATLALLRGDFARAWQLHPLVFVALPALGAAIARIAVARGRSSPASERAITWFAVSLLTLLVGVWLARFAGALGGPVAVDGPIWQREPR